MPHSILNMCRRRGSIRNINISSSSYQLQHLTFTRQFEFWMMMSRATTRMAARSLESTFKCFSCMINGRIYIAWCGCHFNGLWESEKSEKSVVVGIFLATRHTSCDRGPKGGGWYWQQRRARSRYLWLIWRHRPHFCGKSPPNVNFFVIEDFGLTLMRLSRWKTTCQS